MKVMYLVLGVAGSGYSYVASRLSENVFESCPSHVHHKLRSMQKHVSKNESVVLCLNPCSWRFHKVQNKVRAFADKNNLILSIVTIYNEV